MEAKLKLVTVLTWGKKVAGQYSKWCTGKMTGISSNVYLR